MQVLGGADPVAEVGLLQHLLQPIPLLAVLLQLLALLDRFELYFDIVTP